MDRAEAQVRNGRRHARDVNAERTMHEETENETDETEMSGNGRNTRQENRWTERNVERIERNDTGRRERTGVKRAGNNWGGGEVLY